MDSATIDAKIERFENDIQPTFRIHGEDVPHYNVSDRIRRLKIPGVSVAVVNEGKLEWAKGYGKADLGEDRDVDTDTLFLAGSVSKPIAALRTHQLREQGVVDLDTDVNHYLTSWQVPDNEFTTTEKVTLRRILNHTAGLTVWGFPGYHKGDVVPSGVEVLDGKGNTDPVRVYKEPGKSWMYSGGGYTIMQLLIEDVIGHSFSNTMQQHVLDPLGMSRSTFDNPLPDRFHHLAAAGYRPDGSEVPSKWPIYPEMAAAGLWTTPSQLIQYAVEILGIVNSGERGILSPETVREMLTPGENGHGLGPKISEHTFGHDGGDDGFLSRLMVWRERPSAVVIMCNSNRGFCIIDEMLQALAREYSLPGASPVVRKVYKLSSLEREKFVGRYNIPVQSADFDITRTEDGLQLKGTTLDEPVNLLPESEVTFFEKSNGWVLEFRLDDGVVTGFSIAQTQGHKID